MSDLQILDNADPGACTCFAIGWIRSEAARLTEDPKAYITAARRFKTKYPDTSLKIMDHIGSWPSSERELAALQRVWP